MDLLYNVPSIYFNKDYFVATVECMPYIYRLACGRVPIPRQEANHQSLQVVIGAVAIDEFVMLDIF
jgi:hypothetical protein